MLRVILCGALLCLPVMGQNRVQIVGEDLNPNKVTDRSLVESRNIEVKGKNGKMRSAIASIANKVAHDLEMLLKERQEFKGDRTLYIRMVEEGKPMPGRAKVRPRVTPFEDSDIVILLQVDARQRIDRDVLSHGIMEVLLYRRGLQGVNVLEDDQFVSVPAWLSVGLLEAIQWNENNSNRQLYEHLMQRPDLFSLDQTLSARSRDVVGFDATDRAFFEASCCALVLGMLRQENGEEALRQMIQEVVLFEGEPKELIRKYYPSVNVGANGVHKMWSLQIASMATSKLVESMSIVDSDAKLSEYLSYTLEDEAGVAELIDINEYSRLADLKQRERLEATQTMRSNLVQLSNRCHPIYRPLLLEYIALSNDLVNGDTQTVEERLIGLQEQRQKMVVADERCRDYLDWYQITRARTVSGDFSGYMKLKERLAMEREESKDGSIDLYLDRVQKLMGQN